jgi:hypothetical protein
MIHSRLFLGLYNASVWDLGVVDFDGNFIFFGKMK